MPRLRKKDAFIASFSLPPLAEQRIVAKVDELTELCDQSEDSLDIVSNRRGCLLESFLRDAPEPAATKLEGTK